MGVFSLSDIDWSTMHNTSLPSNALIDLMLNFWLHQVVSAPTRAQGIAGSILDFILNTDIFPLELIN